MADDLYEFLTVLIASKEDISFTRASDIVDEAIRNLYDVQDGTSNTYDSYAQVLSDYLDLGESFIRLFPDFWD